MKQYLQGISTKVDEIAIKPLKDKVLAFIDRHPEIFCLSLLTLLCLLFLFFGLNFYPLMDVDETRYAIMARDLLSSWDWNSLYLNGVPFLEKPPLYFWMVASSIKMLGFTGFAVRLPIALSAAFLTFFTYFLGKKVISRKYGMISAIILLSSVFFLILSHIAILDMVLTVFMSSAIYCSFLTHFCEDKYKKYCWWYFYLFAGVGFLAKGILAIAIPFVIIFLYNMAIGKLKEIFKPINMLPGLIIFFIVIVPWHFLMYAEYGQKFIREYFLLHHFARFINSENIGRARPFYYFIPVFLLGFLPWSFIFITFLIDETKKVIAKFKTFEGSLKEKIVAIFEVPTNEQKLVLFSLIYFVVVFVVFSSSSTKLPTYILPAFPAAALLTGYYWWRSDEKSENEKAISISTQIFALIIILAALAGSIGYWFLPVDLQEQIYSFKSATLCGFYLLGIFLLLRLNTKRALSIFSGYVFTIFFIITVSVSYIFNLVYAGGENEICKYANLAQNFDAKLVTFDFAMKPSAMIDYRDRVYYLTDPDFNQLDRILKDKSVPIFVIIKNVNLADPEYAKKIEKRIKLQNSGEKYSLFVKDNGDLEEFDYYFDYLDESDKGDGIKKSPKDLKKLQKYTKKPHEFLRQINGFNEASPFIPPNVDKSEVKK